MGGCELCPRGCKVDRTAQAGFCGVLDTRIARVGLHKWEEPCISGKNGSGTVFFSGCNLRCVFCQNYQISTDAGFGKSTNANQLAQVFLSLQAEGAHNINLVTPTPHIEVIVPAIITAREKGLSLPIVFNTNSYLSPHALNAIAGVVDIYLADIKYTSPALAAKYSGAADYPEAAFSAIETMLRLKGELKTDPLTGLATSGVLLRHLVLPCNVDETRRVVDRIIESFGTSVPLSLMAQYFPSHRVCASEYGEINRPLLKREYARAVDYALARGVENLFAQSLCSASEEFVPSWS